ncbi:MAG: hypothetical protein ACKKL4_01395 [Patescibacteria group bacterium]
MSNIENFPFHKKQGINNTQSLETRAFGHQDYHNVQDEYRKQGFKVEEAELLATVYRRERMNDMEWDKVVGDIRDKAPRHTIESRLWISIIKPSQVLREVGENHKLGDTMIEPDHNFIFKENGEN